MFEHLLAAVDSDFVRYITHVEAVVEEEATVDAGLERAITNAVEIAPGAVDLPGHGAAAPVKREGEKIGRNEPCWCGSGRKFKQCHGRP